MQKFYFFELKDIKGLNIPRKVREEFETVFIFLFFAKRSERPLFVSKSNAKNKEKQNGATYFLVP